MENKDLFILLEGTIHSDKEWCNNLGILKTQFEELIISRIFMPVDKHSFKNIFVGSIKFKDRIFYSLPKFFVLPDEQNDEILRKYIQLVENSLIVYKTRLVNSKMFKTTDNYYLITKNLLSRTEFDLLLSLKDNYFKNGLYRKNIKAYRENKSFTSTNWSRTITKSISIYSNGTPIFINPISRSGSVEDNKITKIHLSVLIYLARKYHYFDYIGKLSTTLKNEKLEHFSEPELRKDSINLLNIINSELKRTYNDELKETLFLIKEFFVGEGMKQIRAFSFFGTSYYHNVWEDALKVITSDKYQVYISEFAQPVYYLQNGNTNKISQEPDILIERENVFYIIDAKYYIIENTKPGWSDIVKQLFYHKSFIQNHQFKNVENIFLFPLSVRLGLTEIQKENEYLGQIVMEHNGRGVTDFSKISILGLNPIKVLRCYCKNEVDDLSFMNLLPAS